jgi:hypothetical protein
MDGEVEILGERIAEQAAHLDAATHRLLADLREFDARGGWHTQGAQSCAHWLAWRVGWDLVTARDRVRVARKLGEFSATDDALRRGELSYSKVRAILRVATPANEAMLLEIARLSTASQLENLSRKYARVQAHCKDARPQDDEQRRYVRRRDTHDGMVKIEAVLHPEEAELVWTMLDHAAKQLLCDPPPRSACGDSAESFVVSDLTTSSGASPGTARPTGDSAESGGAPNITTASGTLQASARGTHDSAEASAVPDTTMVPVSTPAIACPMADSAEACAAPDTATIWASTPGATCPPDDSAEACAAPDPVTVRVSTPGTTCRTDDSAEAFAVSDIATVWAPTPGTTYPTDDSAEACAAPDPVTARISTPGTTRPPGDSSEVSAVSGMAVASGTDTAAVPGDGSASSPASVPARPASGLRQAADAAKRAFNRADALLAITQAFLRGDRPNRTPIDVMVTIPLSDLREGAADPADVGCMGASCLGAETARRLSCDAGVIKVVEDEHGVPLSVGRKRRTIAGSIKRALLKRDTACAYPGCTNRIFLEGHHVRHWADGGETTLENACLLCSNHHRYVHEYGYRIELGADQRPQFRDPRGRLVAAVPARPTAPDLGWPRIRAANEALAIDAGTIACEWDGTPMRYGAVVGQLVVVDGLT